MAKYEDRDPRWLVEERSDSRNVNNWHWNDKDMSNQTLNFFSTEFKDKSYKIENAEFKATSITIPDGESFVSVRKGKTLKIFCFDVQIDGKYIKDLSEISISVMISHVSNEDDNKSFSVDVNFNETIINDNNSINGIKTLFKLQFEKALIGYKQFLDKEAEKLLVPIGKSNEQETTLKVSDTKTSSCTKQSTSSSSDIWTSVNIEEEFCCSPEQVYEFFVCGEKMSCATGTQCMFDPKVNGSFSMFNGAVEGFFTKLSPYLNISMKWRFSTWKKDHYSIVDIVMNQPNKDGFMKFTLNQYNIPTNDSERTLEGWKQRVLAPLRYFLGLSSPSV